MHDCTQGDDGVKHEYEYCDSCVKTWLFRARDHLAGLVVKASASDAEDPGF